MLVRCAIECVLHTHSRLLQGMVHQMILGDLNTMGHGVARLSPRYCCDAMRWRSLGWYEAAWWHVHVLSQVSHKGLHEVISEGAAFCANCLHVWLVCMQCTRDHSPELSVQFVGLEWNAREPSSRTQGPCRSGGLGS